LTVAGSLQPILLDERSNLVPARLHRDFSVRLCAFRRVVEQLGIRKEILEPLHFYLGPADTCFEIGASDRAEEPDLVALDWSADAAVELSDDGRRRRAHRGRSGRLAGRARR